MFLPKKDWQKIAGEGTSKKKGFCQTKISSNNKNKKMGGKISI